jgi:SAM-dependent methyltransferase
MGFSKNWDKKYKDMTHLSIWPWSDLVSFVMRYSKPRSDDFSVLEVGCGAGANIPFFAALKCQYYAVDGSRSIVKQLKKTFPAFAGNIVVGDFSKEIPFNRKFDLVVDRAALTHNTTKDIKKTIDLIKSKLKKGGLFIGIDWFSTIHSDYASGEKFEDKYTCSGYDRGQFTGVGRVHFSDKKHLEELLSSFDIEVMEHKTINIEKPKKGHVFASWNFSARKR